MTYDDTITKIKIGIRVSPTYLIPCLCLPLTCRSSEQHIYHHFSVVSAIPTSKLSISSFFRLFRSLQHRLYQGSQNSCYPFLLFPHSLVHSPSFQTGIFTFLVYLFAACTHIVLRLYGSLPQTCMRLFHICSLVPIQPPSCIVSFLFWTLLSLSLSLSLNLVFHLAQPASTRSRSLLDLSFLELQGGLPFPWTG